MSSNDVRDPVRAPLSLESALTNSEEWRDLTPEQVQDVEKAAELKEFGKGDLLAAEGGPCDGIHIICSGLVGVRKGADTSHPILFRLFRPGETLGLQPLLSEGNQLSNMTALLPTTTWFLDRHFVMPLIHSNCEVCSAIQRRMARYVTFVVEQAFAREAVDLRTRVRDLIHELDEDFGVSGPDGERLTELPITRHDIADMLGARRESVSRIITELNEEGAISLHGRHLRVFD